MDTSKLSFRMPKKDNPFPEGGISTRANTTMHQSGIRMTNDEEVPLSRFETLSIIQHSFTERKKIQEMMQTANQYDKQSYGFVHHAQKTQENEYLLQKQKYARVKMATFRKIFESYVKQYESTEKGLDSLEQRVDELIEGIQTAQYHKKLNGALIISQNLILLVEIELLRSGVFHNKEETYIMRVHKDNYMIKYGTVGEYPKDIQISQKHKVSHFEILFFQNLFVIFSTGAEISILNLVSIGTFYNISKTPYILENIAVNYIKVSQGGRIFVQNSLDLTVEEILLEKKPHSNSGITHFIKRAFYLEAPNLKNKRARTSGQKTLDLGQCQKKTMEMVENLVVFFCKNLIFRPWIKS